MTRRDRKTMIEGIVILIILFVTLIAGLLQ